MKGETDAERFARLLHYAKSYPQEFNDYAFLIKYMDSRVIGLLTSNNRLTSERNVAKGRADHFEQSVDFLLRHNGMAQLRRLEAENRILTEERDTARHEMREAWARAEINLDAAQQVKALKAELALIREIIPDPD